MRYRNRGPRWGRRGIMGFPFMLFFIIFLVTHSFSGFMVGIAVLVVLAIIFRAALPGMFSGWNTRNTMPPYQPPQQPYQQPYQPYQPTDQPYQPEYEPYQQGYQSAPPPPVYQAPEQQYQPPQQNYEEQPQAEYPQEMPPMQQH